MPPIARLRDVLGMQRSVWQLPPTIYADMIRIAIPIAIMLTPPQFLTNPRNRNPCALGSRVGLTLDVDR